MRELLLFLTFAFSAAACATVPPHRWEPYSGATKNGVSPTAGLARRFYEGDAQTLTKVDAQTLGYLFTHAKDESFVAELAASYGATHFGAVDHWRATMPNERGKAKGSTRGYYALVRVTPERWSDLPQNLAVIPLSESRCEVSYRDSFGTYDPHKPWLECAGKAPVRLDPETMRPLQQ